MPPQLIRLLCSFALVFSCLAQASHATEKRVTLRAIDGAVAVSGFLMQFDGTNYKVSTQLGEMVLEADQVECEGACPVAPTQYTGPRLTLAIGDDLNPG